MTEEKNTQERPPQGEAKPKAAPKERAKSKGRGEPLGTPPKVTPGDKRLQEGIAGTYQMIGGLVMMTATDIPTRDAGVHILNQADAVAATWMDLAKANPKVKTFLVKFTEGTALAGIVAIHVTTFAPLLAAKGLVPDQVAQVLAMSANLGNGATPGAGE